MTEAGSTTELDDPPASLRTAPDMTEAGSTTELDDPPNPGSIEAI
jgi:hypothetical protein